MKKFFLVMFAVGCFLVASLLSAVAQARVVSKTVVHEHHHTHVHRAPAVTVVRQPAMVFQTAPVHVAPAPAYDPAPQGVNSVSAPAVVYTVPRTVMVYSAKPTAGTVTVDPSVHPSRGDLKKANKIAKHGLNVQIN
jgi:hypothetical protein